MSSRLHLQNKLDTHFEVMNLLLIGSDHPRMSDQVVIQGTGTTLASTNNQKAGTAPPSRFGHVALEVGVQVFQLDRLSVCFPVNWLKGVIVTILVGNSRWITRTPSGESPRGGYGAVGCG